MKVTLKQNEEKPMEIEVIAESIKSISTGIKKLMNGPLNSKALFLLIQHAAPSVGYGRSLCVKMMGRNRKLWNTISVTTFSALIR